MKNNWERTEKENKRKGIATTIIIHAILLVIFFLFGLSSKFPPPTIGIPVILGSTDVGSGEAAPSEVIEPNEQVSAEPVESTPLVQEQVEQEVVTQDVVKAPPVVKEPEKKKEEVKPVKEETKKPVKEEQKKPEKEEPQVDKTSLYTGNPSDEDAPSNKGDDLYAPGDKGSPDGDRTAKSYSGGGEGTNIGYELGGRNMLYIQPIEEDYTETGKVVVYIKVDRSGKVLSAKYTVKGSTTTDPTLIRLAEKAAREAKFSPDTKAAEEQFGTITFTFKLK